MTNLIGVHVSAMPLRLITLKNNKNLNNLSLLSNAATLAYFFKNFSWPLFLCL